MQADEFPRLLARLEVLFDPGGHLGVVALAGAGVAEHDHVRRTIVERIEVERRVGLPGEPAELRAFLGLRDEGAPDALARAVARRREEVVGRVGVGQRGAQLADIGVMVAEHRVEGHRPHQRGAGLLGGLGRVHVGRPEIFEIMEAPPARVDDVAQRDEEVGLLLGDAVGDRVLARLAVGEVADHDEPGRLVGGLAGAGGALGEDLAVGAEGVAVLAVRGEARQRGHVADVTLRLFGGRDGLGGRRGELEFRARDLGGDRLEALGGVLEGERGVGRLGHPDDLDLVGGAERALRSRLHVRLDQEGRLGRGDRGGEEERGQEGHGDGAVLSRAGPRSTEFRPGLFRGRLEEALGAHPFPRRPRPTVDGVVRRAGAEAVAAFRVDVEFGRPVEALVG